MNSATPPLFPEAPNLTALAIFEQDLAGLRMAHSLAEAAAATPAERLAALALFHLAKAAALWQQTIRPGLERLYPERYLTHPAATPEHSTTTVDPDFAAIEAAWRIVHKDSAGWACPAELAAAAQLTIDRFVAAVPRPLRALRMRSDLPAPRRRSLGMDSPSCL